MNKVQPSVIDLSPEDFEVSPSELRVFAIQAPHMPFYRLAHFMNASGDWKFYHTRLDYIPTPGCVYHVLHYDDLMRHIKWFILGKEPDTPPFIAAMPMADCFVMAAGSGVESLDETLITEELSALPDIFYVEYLKDKFFNLFSRFYDFLSNENLLLEE